MAKPNDKKFYQEIWETRDHVSEVSGTPLGDQPNATYFAHILGKGAYPAFRHRKDNLMLMTFEEHYMYDHETHKAREDERFDKVFAKAEELKQEYFRSGNHKTILSF